MRLIWRIGYVYCFFHILSTLLFLFYLCISSYIILYYIILYYIILFFRILIIDSFYTMIWIIFNISSIIIYIFSLFFEMKHIIYIIRANNLPHLIRYGMENEFMDMNPNEFSLGAIVILLLWNRKNIYFNIGHNNLNIRDKYI